MHCNYILRRDNDLFCFYHSGESGIVYREYSNGRWSHEKIIVSEGRKNFTVTRGLDKAIYVFSQDIQGDIIMSGYKEGEWSSRVALKNPSDRRRPVLLHPVFTENGSSIIYNVSGDDGKNSYIVSQELSSTGQWLPASRIDMYHELNDTIYQVQQLTNEHMILFYQKKNAESNLGYREMTPKKLGAFNVFQTTNYLVTDTAFLTTNNGIHILYIIKSMFSSQLIYRKKTSEVFSNPIVLCEGQNIQNCLLYFIKDNLYATFVNNSQLYYCLSEDKGDSFNRPAKYAAKFCMEPIKAVYISDNQSENTLYCRQVYVDKLKQWDIQLLPDMYEEFYPHTTRNYQAPEVEYISNDDSSEYAELVSRLKNQILMIRKQCDGKDSQIMELTALLKNRNEEILKADLENKNITEKYISEINELKKRINFLEEEKKRLEDLYKNIPADLNN